MSDSPWLTFPEAIAYSKRSRATIARALRAGTLRGNQIKEHSSWLFHRDDIDAWIRGEIVEVRPQRVTRRRSA